MGKNVAQMTEQELRDIVGDAVEEKLLELLADPDEGLEIRPELRSRLLDQQRQVSAGERGRSFDEVAEELGLL